jgi:hypothetical protein
MYDILIPDLVFGSPNYVFRRIVSPSLSRCNPEDHIKYENFFTTLLDRIWGVCRAWF